MTIEEFVEDLRKQYKNIGCEPTDGMFHLDNLIDGWENACNKTTLQNVPLFWLKYIKNIPDIKADPPTPNLNIMVEMTHFDRDTRKLI